MKKNNDAYAPVEYEIVKKRKHDMSIVTLDQMMVALYGEHYCQMKELEVVPVNEQVVKRICSSYDLESQEAIYEICFFKWFRKLVPVLPMKNFRQKKEKEEMLVITNYEEAVACGNEATYFAGYDFLYLFHDCEINTNVIVKYNNDYVEFLKNVYDPLQLSSLVLQFNVRMGAPMMSYAIENYLELLNVIEDVDLYHYIIYDDYTYSMTMACYMRGLRFTTVKMRDSCTIVDAIELVKGKNDDCLQQRGSNFCVLYVMRELEIDPWIKYDIKRGIVFSSVDQYGYDEIHVCKRKIEIKKNDRVVVSDRYSIVEERVDTIVEIEKIYGECSVCGVKDIMDPSKYNKRRKVVCQLCLESGKIGYDKKRKYGNFDISDKKHVEQIQSTSFRLGLGYYVTSGLHWMHRRTGAYYYKQHGIYYYLMSSGFRRIFRIDIVEAWNGVSLMFFRVIKVGKFYIGVYKDRDKMSALEYLDVVKWRMKENVDNNG